MKNDFNARLSYFSISYINLNNGIKVKDTRYALNDPYKTFRLFSYLNLN